MLKQMDFAEHRNLTAQYVQQGQQTNIPRLGCAPSRRLVASADSCTYRSCEPKPDVPEPALGCAVVCNRNGHRGDSTECDTACTCKPSDSQASICWMLCVQDLTTCALENQTCSGQTKVCEQPESSPATPPPAPATPPPAPVSPPPATVSPPPAPATPPPPSNPVVPPPASTPLYLLRHQLHLHRHQPCTSSDTSYTSTAIKPVVPPPHQLHLTASTLLTSSGIVIPAPSLLHPCRPRLLLLHQVSHRHHCLRLTTIMHPHLWTTKGLQMHVKTLTPLLSNQHPLIPQLPHAYHVTKSHQQHSMC
ncbi:hypothetical protein Plhal703r1_c03g0015931 [Plasmopara halstedii]